MTNEDRIQQIIDILEDANFVGTDVSTDIALFEYDFLYNEDTGETIIFQEPINDVLMELEDINPESNLFAVENYSEDDIHELFEDHKDTILSVTGMTESQWYDLWIVHKLSDVLQYGWNQFNWNVNELIKEYK